MTDAEIEAMLIASEFVNQCAAVAREKKFHQVAVGSEMLKHGYTLLTGVSLDEANRAVGAMLLLYDRHIGGTQ